MRVKELGLVEAAEEPEVPDDDQEAAEKPEVPGHDHDEQDELFGELSDPELESKPDDPEPESKPDDPEPELKEKRYELRSALKTYGESRAGGDRERQGRFEGNIGIPCSAFGFTT